MMNELLLLTQIFTVLPIKRKLNYSNGALKRASLLMSLHGAALYLPAVGLSMVLTFLKCPSNINALVTLLFHLLLTGAYHLDGLSDSADGLLSGRERERMLDIMKDSRIGVYGAAALFFDLALKIMIYNDLILTRRIWLLPLLGAVGKLSLCYVAFLGTPAKPDSSGNIFVRNMGIPALAVNTGVAAILGIALGEGMVVIISIAALLLFSLLFTGWAKKQIGGIVGDNLGFSSEIGEMLLGILAVWA
jgi:adenosylcobinamide-GDP ribazoletransferase